MLMQKPCALGCNVWTTPRIDIMSNCVFLVENSLVDVDLQILAYKSD
jgi:hypothetical protein